MWWMVGPPLVVVVVVPVSGPVLVLESVPGPPVPPQLAFGT